MPGYLAWKQSQQYRPGLERVSTRVTSPRATAPVHSSSTNVAAVASSPSSCLPANIESPIDHAVSSAIAAALASINAARNYASSSSSSSSSPSLSSSPPLALAVISESSLHVIEPQLALKVSASALTSQSWFMDSGASRSYT